MNGLLLLVTLLVGIFFVIYKRQMLLKMFSINIASMADEFRIEVETTADRAVKKLEHQMAQLEYLLEEADAKILALEERLRQADEKCVSLSSESMQAEKKQNTELTSNESSFALSRSPQLSHPEQTNAVRVQPQPLPQIMPRLQEVAQDKRQQVLTMHRQGYNVVQIAKATSMGKGEVMLLLELNKN